MQEASPPPEAAAKAEPKKERTQRLDWAGLLRRTFALDVFASQQGPHSSYTSWMPSTDKPALQPAHTLAPLEKRMSSYGPK